ncbi:MAG: type I phosphomannose isomerase catalytic subunit [Anaerolineaceae bacterium]
MKQNHLYPLIFNPVIKNYIWGGRTFEKLVQSSDPAAPIAEIWTVYEGNPIKNGPLAGKTLLDLVAEDGEALLGSRSGQISGRFPLLIKLLDCAQWLSVQVHPTDEQAKRLERQDFGKTEAWHILKAEPGAQLIAGVKPGVSPDALRQAILGGSSILNVLQKHAIHAQDTIFIPAGTIHALGPGAIVYEVQQTSNITYRVYDWDRPRTAGRDLHLSQSIQVANPDALVQVQPYPTESFSGSHTLVTCPYFQLESLQSDGGALEMNTRGESFHALTLVNGSVTLKFREETFHLNPLETILVPAACGAYRLTGTFQMLQSSLGAR